MKYYDLVYGSFSYCSPSCRDQHLLPEYNRKLKEHLSSDKFLSVVNDGNTMNSPGGTSNLVANASRDISTKGLLVSAGTSEMNNKTPNTSQGD